MKHACFATLIFAITLMQGCAVKKQLVATGGSRADGIVKMSFQYGALEVPKFDERQGLLVAKKRCAAWGYTDAEAFGLSTKTCAYSSKYGCDTWLVTVEYQCTGTPPASK